MYSSLKRVGNGSIPEGPEVSEKPSHPVRRLRADSSLESKTKGGKPTEEAAMRKAADILKTITQQQQPQEKELPSSLRLSSAKADVPASPERPKSNASSSFPRNTYFFPKKSTLSTSPTPALPTDLPAPTHFSPSSGRSLPTLTLANEKSSILHGMVRKTKLFFTRFAHHLWIVCRGFVFPFRFLQHPQSKLEY
jgi:hypothetical protein